MVGRALYPIAIHFLIAQIVAELFFAVIVYVQKQSIDVYYRYVAEATGVTALFAGALSLWLYRRDCEARYAGGLIPRKERRLKPAEVFVLLGMGAAAAQFANLFVAFLQTFFAPSVYYEQMERITNNKPLLVMVLWMGIVAPIAEEMIFRWLVFLRLRDWVRFPAAMVISGALFGIYHGNVLQGVYAGILGCFFAYALEATGNRFSCVLLHMGANIWSLIFSEYGMVWLQEKPQIMFVILWAFLGILCFGIATMQTQYKRNGRRK